MNAEETIRQLRRLVKTLELHNESLYRYQRIGWDDGYYSPLQGDVHYAIRYTKRMIENLEESVPE